MTGDSGQGRKSVTFNRNRWSRSVGTTGHVQTESAVNLARNTHRSETRTLIDLIGPVGSDPVIAAEGSGLLLLSDDMGLRTWSAAFWVASVWLQPVLMTARNEGHLSAEKYNEAINAIALSGHRYTSLDAAGLMHQARKSAFEVTNELERLLDTVGGPSADLRTNCAVMSGFLDSVMTECKDDFKAMRMASQVFTSMAKDRAGDQRKIVSLITGGITVKRGSFIDHAMGWLVGHSIGMPDFGEIVELQRRRQVIQSTKAAGQLQRKIGE